MEFLKNPLPETVYLCARCERFVGATRCPTCGQDTAPIRRNTANHVLWALNLERMLAWVKRGRIIPEVE